MLIFDEIITGFRVKIFAIGDGRIDKGNGRIRIITDKVLKPIGLWFQPLLIYPLYSYKWPEKVVDGRTVLRVFLRGDRNYMEDDIKDIVVEDLKKIGLKFEPEGFIIHKREKAFPKYTLGHEERIKKLFEFFGKEGIFLVYINPIKYQNL